MKTRRRIPPPAILAVGLVGVIALGTLLLRLPLATNGQSLSWMDALFTATSAACVTGLTVVDTGSTFTGFGQAVILVLIQIGGLGVMTIGTMVIFALGQRPTAILREVLGGYSPGRQTLRAKELLALVLVTTFGFELLGAAVLFPVFAGEMPIGQAAWTSLFHAVSAFCNAGFALWPDSLSRYATHPVVNGTIASLVILGGLGFVVLVELRTWAHAWIRGGDSLLRFSLHTRIVLSTTAVLLVVGAASFLLFEHDNALAGMSVAERLQVAGFQSMTARTAGFNSVSTASLTIPTLLFMIFLMFIGAGPGSMAGGIKVTSAATMAAYVFHHSRGHREVRMFRRAIGQVTIQRAGVISLVSVLVGATAILLLAVDCGRVFPREILEARFLAIVFEAISALGTVGLSMGMTSELPVPSRFVLIALMILGRVGPLALMDYYRHLPPEPDVRRAQEQLMVG